MSQQKLAENGYDALNLFVILDPFCLIILPIRLVKDILSIPPCRPCLFGCAGTFSTSLAAIRIEVQKHFKYLDISLSRHY